MTSPTDCLIQLCFFAFLLTCWCCLAPAVIDLTSVSTNGLHMICNKERPSLLLAVCWQACFAWKTVYILHSFLSEKKMPQERKSAQRSATAYLKINSFAHTSPKWNPDHKEISSKTLKSEKSSKDFTSCVLPGSWFKSASAQYFTQAAHFAQRNSPEAKENMLS